MRIWEQGLVATFSIPGYRQLITDHYAAVSGELDVEIEIHGVRDVDSATARSVAGKAVNYISLARMHEGQIARNALRAEASGCDGMVIGIWQDSGLEEARSVVDVPVVGYGEVSMYAGLFLGDRLGAVAINPEMDGQMKAIVSRRGLEARVAPSGYMRCGYEALIAGVAGDDQQFLDAFVESATALVQHQGVDVLMPGQTIISELLWRAGMVEVAGAPIVDPRFWALRIVAALKEYQLQGFPQSRLGFYRAKPPPELFAAMDEYLSTPIVKGG